MSIDSISICPVYWWSIRPNWTMSNPAEFLLAKVNNANKRPAGNLKLLSMEYNCLQVEPFFKRQCLRIMKIFHSFSFVSRVLLISLRDIDQIDSGQNDWAHPDEAHTSSRSNLPTIKQHTYMYLLLCAKVPIAYFLKSKE